MSLSPAFNPFAHFDKLPFSNIFGGTIFGIAWQPTITLPGGQVIPSAIEGQPDTVQYYLQVAGAYQPITDDQAFAQQMWLHATLGAWAPRPDAEASALVQLGLAQEYSVTAEALREAVYSLPHVLADIQAAGWSEAQAWAYTQAVAPWAVDLVGVPA